MIDAKLLIAILFSGFVAQAMERQPQNQDIIVFEINGRELSYTEFEDIFMRALQASERFFGGADRPSGSNSHINNEDVQRQRQRFIFNEIVRLMQR